MPRPRALVSERESIFAANIASARAARGWSLDHVVTAIGGIMGTTALWRSERDGRRVTVGEALALCEVLDLDIHEATSRVLRFRVEVTVETEALS